MKLQENIDYVLSKRAGYFGKSRLDQFHGNMAVTQNRIIINIIQNVNPIKTMQDSPISQTEYVHGSSINPITQIKYSVQDIKVASKDFKSSIQQSKEEFRKLGDFSRCLKILKEVANDSETLEEFENRAAGVGEDDPMSLNIALSQIQKIKFGWLGPAKMFLNDGTILKVFITNNKKDVKKFLGNFVKII